jgi:hypothetical protein
MSERFAAVNRCLNRLRHHPVLLHSACGDEGVRDLSCAWSELDAANQELRNVAPANAAQQAQQAICPRCANCGIVGLNVGDDGHTEYCDCPVGKQLAVR